MLKALVWKEFRELLPLIVVTMVIVFCLIGSAIGLVPWNTRPLPEHVQMVWPLLIAAGILFPIAIGLWQINCEESQGIFQFLLHRPLSRRAIFGTKLLLGCAVCLLVVFVPIIGFAYWAEGRNSIDKGPWMSRFAWQLCSGVLLYYLGAFFSKLRPARWYGSQFFPLLGVSLLFIVLQIIANVSSFWRYAALAVGPFIVGSYIFGILHVGKTREFS